MTQSTGTGSSRGAGDLALVREVLSGDSEAEGRLARRLYVVRRLLAAQNRRLACPLDEDALDDVAQDVTVTIWRRLADFEGRASLEAWSYRFCFHELMNAVRRGRHRVALELDQVEDPAAREPTEDGRTRGLERYLDHLTGREAQVLRLRHVEDLTFGQIAGRLSISASSAKTYHSRALGKLRQLVDARGEDVQDGAGSRGRAPELAASGGLGARSA